jgi:hypothetical protein
MNIMNYKITNINNKWVVSFKTEFNTKKDALNFIADQDEKLNNDINNDINIDNLIDEYIEKTDNKNDFVSLKNLYDYISSQINNLKKKDFFNIIKKHSFYGKHYKRHIRYGSNLLLGFKYKYDNHLIDQDIFNNED